MKKLLGFIFFTLIVCVVTAQQSHKFELATKDSLEKLLLSSQPDTNRVMIFSELSIRYYAFQSRYGNDVCAERPCIGTDIEVS